jgi:predicted DNA-binding protein
MAARTGRPTSDNPKDKGYRLRMSGADLEKLDYCCKVLGLTKAEVIRQGIDRMYAEAHKKAQK